MPRTPKPLVSQGPWRLDRSELPPALQLTIFPCGPFRPKLWLPDRDINVAVGCVVMHLEA